MKIIGTAILVAGLLGAFPAIAAELSSTESDRPRIGLVLGGGGARGAAHIGVLRELERLRVPIDAIAGTSMGAIVGGLYASGRTPDELEMLVDSIDWADAFTDGSPRSHLTFRRKEDDEAYPANLELGVRDGSLQIPKGAIQGQKLQLILREQLLHVSHVKDFDELPTPFRAVASDLETGTPYVMSTGDLALAVRASMSAPGIFAPVDVDGRTLVDGGLVGNVPVDVVRDMGVDIVIAVDVEFPLYPPDQLQSALQITEQMLTILIRKETLRQLEGLGAQDVLIRPDLGEYASTNFDEIQSVIEPGRSAAAEQAGSLTELSLPEEDYASFQARRLHQDHADETTIDFVRIVNDGPLSGEVLLDRLSTEPGDRLDIAKLADDVSRLYGLGYFEHVGYELVSDDGESGIEFTTRAKSWGPNFLKFGLSLEDDFEGATAFNVAARLTATGLNRLGAEWRNDAQIGTNPALSSEFYQPLGFDTRIFVAPRFDLEQRNVKAFSGVDTVARYRITESTLGLDFGVRLGRWGEIRAGAFRGAGEARVKIGDPTLPNEDFDQGGALISFKTDTLDDAQIPKFGTRSRVDWLMSRPGLGADGNFDTFAGVVEKYWSWGSDNRNTVQVGLEYATTIGDDLMVQDYFTLGGFLRLSGLARGELSGPHIGLAKAVYYRQVGHAGGGIFNMPVYLGGSIEAGNAWLDRSNISLDSTIVNGSLFAGLDTFFGQLYVAAGFSEDGESNFYLFLGNQPR